VKIFFGGRRNPASGGFTILELVVAVSLMAVLSVIVYSTWTRISNHMLLQQRNSSMRTECHRLLNEITNRIRGSEAVVRWDRTSIRFVSSGGADTLTYSFDGTALQRSSVPIQIITPLTEVKEFTVENLNNNDGVTPFLLKITLTLRNKQGNEFTDQATVLGRRLNAPANGDDFVW
jgi:prepilin-type N-terminal cleavage/methylation domain-containing protein